MGESRATIRTRVQGFVGSAINNTINEAIREAFQEAQRQFNWQDMETDHNVSISEGDSVFSLPSGFKEELNPEMPDSDALGYQRMKKILKNGIESRNVDDEGRPLMYRIWKKQGYLYAKADADYTFPIEYYQWLGPIDSDTAPTGSTATLLDKIHKFLEFRAIAAGFRRLKEWNAADKWDGRANEKLAELIIDEEAMIEANQDLQMEMPG